MADDAHDLHSVRAVVGELSRDVHAETTETLVFRLVGAACARGPPAADRGKRCPTLSSIEELEALAALLVWMSPDEG